MNNDSIEVTIPSIQMNNGFPTSTGFQPNAEGLTLNDIDRLIEIQSNKSKSRSGSSSKSSKSSASSSGSGSSSGSSEYAESDYGSDVISIKSKGSGRRRNSRSDEIREKQEMLYQLNRLARKGVRLPTTFTMDSDINEMRAEYERLMRDYDIDRSVQFQRKMVMTVVTGVEYLNTTFNPMNVRLEGWSEQVHDDIDDYDDIFEELHDIYKGKAKIRPELRLLFSLAGSAIMFHLSNTLFKSSMPGLDQVLKQNPALMKQVMSAAMNTMTDNMSQDKSPAGGFGAGLSKMMSSFMGGAGKVGTGATREPQPPPPPPVPQQPKMRGPGNFEDLIKENTMMNNIETFSAVDDDDEVSLSNFSITSKGNRILNL